MKYIGKVSSVLLTVAFVVAIVFANNNKNEIQGSKSSTVQQFQEKNQAGFVAKKRESIEVVYDKSEEIATQETNRPLETERTPQVGNKEIIPVEVFHGKLPIIGYRIDNFAYLTDVKSISDNEILKLKNLDILVLNALRQEEHHSHLSLDQAISLSRKINPKKTYLTHISHHMGFHDEIQKTLPKNIYIAYDNLSIKSI